MRRVYATVPGWVRWAFLGERRADRLIFDASANEVRVSGAQVVAPARLLDPGQDPHATRRKRLVDIALPKSRLLERQIAVPARATGREVTELARLDLMHRTPFGADDVAWSLVRRSGTRNAVQWVAKRSVLNDLVQRLAKGGLIVRRIGIEGEPSAAPLLDRTAETAPHARSWRRINAGLALATVLAGAVVWTAPAFRTRSVLVERRAQVDAARQTALEMRQTLDALRAAETERASFVNAVLHHPRLSTSLRELTVALPDDAWISSLTYANTRLVISGETAGSAADLVLALDKHGGFASAGLSGAVARTAQGHEKFEISIEQGIGE